MALSRVSTCLKVHQTCVSFEKFKFYPSVNLLVCLKSKDVCFEWNLSSHDMQLQGAHASFPNYHIAWLMAEQTKIFTCAIAKGCMRFRYVSIYHHVVDIDVSTLPFFTKGVLSIYSCQRIREVKNDVENQTLLVFVWELCSTHWSARVSFAVSANTLYVFCSFHLCTRRHRSWVNKGLSSLNVRKGVRKGSVTYVRLGPDRMKFNKTFFKHTHIWKINTSIGLR